MGQNGWAAIVLAAIPVAAVAFAAWRMIVIFRKDHSMTTTTETIDPRTGRVDIVKRFRQWVDAGRPGLTADETAVCATGIQVSEDDERYEEADENGWVECGKTSRFIVERSDFDASYGELGGGCEACEEHVAEEMFLMLEGVDAIRAVVTPRWDAAGPDEKG